VTGRNTEQLSYRIELVEGLFTKYACAAECIGATGIQQHSSTAHWKTFSKKSGTQNWKSKPQRRCVVCSKHG